MQFWMTGKFPLSFIFLLFYFSLFSLFLFVLLLLLFSLLLWCIFCIFFQHFQLYIDSNFSPYLDSFLLTIYLLFSLFFLFFLRKPYKRRLSFGHCPKWGGGLNRNPKVLRYFCFPFFDLLLDIKWGEGGGGSMFQKF